MKRFWTSMLAVLLFLSLTACGGEGKAVEVTPTAPIQTPSGKDQESAPPAQSQELDVLTSEEIEAARQAAFNYYASTVFEIQSLMEMEPREGEIMFRVVCSKDGEPQVDRTIALERQDGMWTVINEGY